MPNLHNKIFMFSTRLEQLRAQAQKTQKEFAEFIGVPLRTYANWISGKNKPAILALPTIAQKCGVSVEWILGHEHFGGKMRKLRDERKLSLETFAKKIAAKNDALRDMPITSWVDIENESATPSNEVMDAVVDFFGVTREEFLGEDMPLESKKILSPSPSAPRETYPVDPMTKGAEFEPELIPIVRRVPLVGMAAALTYNPLVSTMDEFLEGTSETAIYMGEAQDVFALHISGNSMAPKYIDGDIIAVRSMLPRTGDTCIALHRKDGIICKEWYWRKCVIKLISFNKRDGKHYEWKFDDFQAEQPLVWRFKVEALIWRKDSVKKIAVDDDE